MTKRRWILVWLVASIIWAAIIFVVQRPLDEYRAYKSAERRAERAAIEIERNNEEDSSSLEKMTLDVMREVAVEHANTAKTTLIGKAALAGVPPILALFGGGIFLRRRRRTAQV